jgi:CBS domain-containing protein
MQVKDAMSKVVLTIGPEHTIREAAELMTRRHVGSAAVVDDALPGPGVITERDILRAVAEGVDPQATQVRDAMTFEARTATESWDLDDAAQMMVTHGFRHLLVVDARGDLCGVLSMRDVVRARLHGALPHS